MQVSICITFDYRDYLRLQHVQCTDYLEEEKKPAFTEHLDTNTEGSCVYPLPRPTKEKEIGIFYFSAKLVGAESE